MNIEQAIADIVDNEFHDASMEKPKTITFPPQKASIADQLGVFERAGAERQRLEADFERRLAEYEATVRATIIDMKAAHELELQTLERLVKRFETLG